MSESPTPITKRIKCLTSGNPSTLFDADGLPVSVESGGQLTLQLSFWTTIYDICNLIFLKSGNSTHDWADDSNPDATARPDTASAICSLVVKNSSGAVFTKAVTFADVEEAYISASDFASGDNHLSVTISAGVLVRGAYTVSVSGFARWFRNVDYGAFQGDWAHESGLDFDVGTLSVTGAASSEESTAVSQLVRCAFDSAAFADDAVDLKTNSPVKIYAGNSATFQLGLFTSSAIPATLIAAATRIDFVLKDSGEDWYPSDDGGAVLTKTVSSINTGLTASTWTDGSAQHAEIVLSSEDTSITPGVRWLCVNVVGGSGVVTFYAGRIYVLDSGVLGTHTLAEAGEAKQTCIDTLEQMCQLVNTHTTPNALYERMRGQLNSGSAFGRICIGEDHCLYIFDASTGGDNKFHKLVPARRAGVLTLALEEEGYDNV